MGKGFSFFSVFFLVFLVWTMLGKSNEQRIERVCKPFGWTGNVSVSLFSLVGSKAENRVHDTFDRVLYGCEYSVWRLVFENRYLDIVRTYAEKENKLEFNEQDIARIKHAADLEAVPFPPITVEQRKALREKLNAEGFGKNYNFSLEQ